MSRETIGLTAHLLDYVRKVGAREDADLAALREETASHPMAIMQIAPEQGQFMALLMRLLNARHTLEVGVFTGYSAMAVAKAMGPQGRVVALDINEEYTAIARRHWAKAGVAQQIDLRLGPAADSLRALAGGEPFDFAFIDADKSNYDTYYELCLGLLRRGGLIAIDNVLWSGKVADLAVTDKDTVALRQLNAKIAQDARVAISMVPIGDGLTLAMKL